MKNYRALYLITGTLTLISSAITLQAHISTRTFPESIMTVGITIMMFCLAYLAPHFAEKDERAQKIRERGVFVSYFWGMGFALLLILILGPLSSIQLSGYHAILLYVTFYMSIVFLNMVYYAKKY